MLSTPGIGQGQSPAPDRMLRDSVVGSIASSDNEGSHGSLNQPNALSMASLDARAFRATAALDAGRPSVVDVRRPEPGLFATLLDYGGTDRARGIGPRVVDLRADAPKPEIGYRALGAVVEGVRRNERATIENILLVGAAKFLSGIQSGLRRLSQG